MYMYVVMADAVTVYECAAAHAFKRASNLRAGTSARWGWGWHNRSLDTCLVHFPRGMMSEATTPATVKQDASPTRHGENTRRLKLHDFDPVVLLGIFVATNVALAFFFHDTPVHTIFLWVSAIYIPMALYLAIRGIPLPKVSTS